MRATRTRRLLAPVLEQVREALNEARPVRALGLAPEALARIRDLHLLTVKPVMYIANVAEGGFEDNPWLDEVRP